MRSYVSLLWLALNISQPSFGQAIKSGNHLELRQGASSPAAAPARESGDVVLIDGSGTIVSTSRGQTFNWPLTNQMKPKVDVNYSLVSGRVQYKYQVANGPGALKTIGSVMLYITPPSDIAVPSPWAVTSHTNPNEPPAVGWNRVDHKGSQAALLAPGATLGPITFTSDMAPGLVEMVVFPDPEIGVKSASGLTNGEFFEGASAWVQQQLLQLDLPSRHFVRFSVIGPSTTLASDSVALIRSELSAAATQRADFNELRASIHRSAMPSDQIQLRRWVSDLRKDSGKGLQGAFMDAISWRLQLLQ